MDPLVDAKKPEQHTVENTAAAAAAAPLGPADFAGGTDVAAGPAAAAAAAAAAAGASAVSGLAQKSVGAVVEQQQRIYGPAPLGPAALALVKQELGALPSQQQHKYWQLADLPYDAAELSQHVEQYLLPYIAERHVAHESRSGRAPREGPLLVPVRIPRIQQHYPVLAPAVLQLYEQVQEEQQQRQEQQQQEGRDKQKKKRHQQGQEQQQKKRRRQQQQKQGSSGCFFASTPSSERLLLVLRCLCLWGRHQAQEQQLPSLLQGLLSKTRASTLLLVVMSAWEVWVSLVMFRRWLI